MVEQAQQNTTSFGEKPGEEPEFQQQSRKRWDTMSDWYSRFERFAVQSTTTCLEMTDARYCDRVLEVACGAGTHSEVIAKGFLSNKGSVLVSSDFSKEMVTKLKERFEQSDYNEYKGCKHVIDNETDYTDQSTPKRLDLDKI